MTRQAIRRQAARTLLLVGEGDAEEMFLRHLKGLFVVRGSGLSVTIKNARGKGAAHVVDFAHRHSLNAAFDEVAALLDADTDWNDKTRAAAKRAKVQVVVCDPCLEALLLQLHAVPVEGKHTQQLKQDFAARFGGPAHDQRVLQQFSSVDWVAAGAKLPVMASLLKYLGSHTAKR